MSKILLLCAALFLSVNVISQTIEEYVKEGISYHDAGNYDEAIASYKEAYKIDSKNELVNYEIGLSYFAMGDFDKAIKHADVTIKANGQNLIPAYILKGSALDNDGRTEESVKMFKKAIKKTDGHYLLHYNLGLNYYKLREMENCEEQMEDALNLNPAHTTSHLLLGLIHADMGHKVQTVLALSFFLYLEDDTDRSVTANEKLLKAMGSNVVRDADEPNQITINISGDMDSEFMSAELMLSLLEASKSLEENEGKTEEELFEENLKSFFTTMGELKKDNASGIWWTTYTDTFYALAKSEHMTTFCKVITQTSNKEAALWLETHQDEEKALDEWFKTQMSK